MIVMYSCDPCDEFLILLKLNLVIVVTLVKCDSVILKFVMHCAME